MLVVIIVLTAVVLGELGRRLFWTSPSIPSSTSAPATPVAAVPPAALPAGSRIASIVTTGDRAVTLITLPGGGQELRSIDPRTGASVTLLTTSP
jgi:hypothetical protein